MDFWATGTETWGRWRLAKLKAVLEIPQSYRGKLEKISRIDMKVEELGLGFILDKNLKQRVRVIPDASIFSGNIKVQVELPSHLKTLFPGLTLEARLQFDTRREVKHVPSIALDRAGRRGSVGDAAWQEHPTFPGGASSAIGVRSSRRIRRRE